MREAWPVALAVLAGGAATAAAAWVAPLATLNTLARMENVRTIPGLAYAEGARHGVDVYVPATGGNRLPVVVFFYGGGWEGGDRGLYRFVGTALASRGIVAVIPDYRVYPEVRFPDFLKDAAQAVRWARDHAGGFGGDGHRLVLAGHSAGAHIAAALHFDRQWLQGVGLDAGRDIAGLVGLAGPYDFLPLHSRTLEEIFGPEPGRALSQPINFVRGGEAPAFLATGPVDDTVDPGNTARLAARIRARGGEVIATVYERIGHRTILGAFSRPLRLLAPVLDDTSAFIHDVTGREARS
ncbi:alpha/beta hydrolase [Ancylobacter defluvii]|uniref:Carboxylesterase n=1 Tax=Ancylobacter defluvii TaxID=1282440 RepID=A0A9W6JUP1_9HYPH|nr:alpha/beta hydrolase [Ancylobacter defluvii]MBS7588803.1 alpha/beta hydrolase [Ancylobacter defluvii]GLK84091.1 carboxylesterase [Ancylobacter defluvii]